PIHVGDGGASLGLFAPPPRRRQSESVGVRSRPLPCAVPLTVIPVARASRRRPIAALRCFQSAGSIPRSVTGEVLLAALAPRKATSVRLSGLFSVSTGCPQGDP